MSFVWNAYQRILGFGQELFNRLSNDDNPDLHPKDMMDIQSFMWCTFAGGWTKDDIKNVKRDLGIIK
jgi:hypothetical protein